MNKAKFLLRGLLGVGILLILLGGCTSINTQSELKGFAYGNEQAPKGVEWQSPEKLGFNKEQPHAWFFSFENTENARKVLPEYSKYWQSLDGNWKFNFAKNPDGRPKDFYKNSYDVSRWDEIPVPSNWNIYGIQKNGDLKYGVPIYVNQKVIFEHKVAVDDWKKGVMRTPNKDWTTYKYRNEVGSYKRSFTIPENWEKREVYISFDGVDSFFYLWINGQYVGFSKNSRNTARFNITDYLQKGENTVSVEVYRNSDGSFLEAQDMFRLPGIFRTVALYAKPKVNIRDLQVIPNLDANYKNGSLIVNADIQNASENPVEKYKLAFSLYKNELYSDESTKVANAEWTIDLPEKIEKENSIYQKNIVLEVKDPAKWSAEEPNRYVLVAQLKDENNKTVETISTYVGFRKVEIKDTKAEDDEFGLAGHYYYINGKTVKLKGVNRHETNPQVGHAITREMMKKEIMLMKRANINHVRNSHYPDS
ncbi:MAG: beta-galactosidase, partial [Candidatus Delongbacteria bacterium]